MLAFRKRPCPAEKADSVVTDVLKLILDLPNRRPAPNLPARLDDLFAELRQDRPERRVKDIESEIWALWTSHEDEAIALWMDRALQAMSKKRHDEAETILAELIAQKPEWAEAWNKRATLYFMMGNYPASIADIKRAIEIEPRHFGATSGFTQICLRLGDQAAALAAAEATLRIHPHLESIRIVVAELNRRMMKTMN